MAVRRPNRSILESLPIRLVTVRLTPAVLVLLSITLMIFHRTDALPVEKIRTTLTDVMAPVLSAAAMPFESLADSIDSMTTLRSLRAENIRLAAENAKLQQWYESALKFQAENLALKDLLNVKTDPSMEFVTTRIMSDPGGAFVKSVLLPVGTEQRINKGAAVLSGYGLVGRIIETGNTSSRALLVTDLNSRIPIVVQNTRTRAILAGKNGELMKLERLPPDSGLVIGQRIVTSGDGGQLPADIPVGTIADINPDGVFIRPLSAMSELTYVQVINTGNDPGLVTGHIQK